MTDVINQSKAEIRKRIRAVLSSLDDKQRREASRHACQRLLGLEAFDHANIVMLYMPMANEIDVTPIAIQCFRRGQIVCVPKVNWDRREMEAVEVTSLDDQVMDCDEHGVRVPHSCRPIMSGLIDVVVVPGIAYDPLGNRLGRGGGYYDRYLARLKPTTVTVGLAFDQQIVDKVPVKPHDVAVDLVVTDRRLTQAKAARAEA